ncbi:MAG: hypothetical protein ACE5J4_02195 [Candidatus Aenigmatarchaeota archaeon]
MKKFLIILGILIMLAVAVSAVISSYGSITGYATVEPAIELDIIGSSNDDNYTLKDVHQGETKWSPKIKIKNYADVSIDINMTVSVLPGSAGNESDVELSLWNVYKNETLEIPITIPPEDLYIYVKHYFYPNCTPGNYTFGLNATPI